MKIVDVSGGTVRVVPARDAAPARRKSGIRIVRNGVGVVAESDGAVQVGLAAMVRHETELAKQRVRGLLDALGVKLPDTGARRGALRGVGMGPVEPEWIAFVEAWFATRRGPMLSSELVDLAMRTPDLLAALPLPVSGTDETPSTHPPSWPRRLGRALEALEGRPLGGTGLRVRRRGTRARAILWQVSRDGSPGGCV